MPVKIIIMMNINLTTTTVTFTFFIVAISEVKIRLVNSRSSKNNSGRIEVYHGNFGWGTVCGGWLSWYDTESGVACRQLGFTGANATRKGTYYGEGCGPILLYEVQCTGNESYIWDCYHNGWKKHDYCQHSLDVGVDCY